MVIDKKLQLYDLGVGSLPHNKPEEALKLVTDCFEIPFFPQLAAVNRNEDMILQVIEGFPGLVKTDEKIYIDNESDNFFEQLEEFFLDYEEIIADATSDKLDKYGISTTNSSTFELFIEYIRKSKCEYAKGQIVGPFTLTTSLNDINGRSIYYDETLREITVKLLTLKALWQIQKIKQSGALPIIFMDEPSISQLGTSAFITIPNEEVKEILTQVSDIIKQHGALSAIHCCGKCEWKLPIESGINIINLDAYSYAQNLSIFAPEVKNFLERDGIIAWGIVPTLDKTALESATIDKLSDKFDEAVNYLVEKGIDKDLILKHSMLSTSCGAGGLTVELAEKAMKLVKELSQKLKEKYIE